MMATFALPTFPPSTAFLISKSTSRWYAVSGSASISSGFLSEKT